MHKPAARVEAASGSRLIRWRTAEQHPTRWQWKRSGHADAARRGAEAAALCKGVHNVDQHRWSERAVVLGSGGRCAADADAGVAAWRAIRRAAKEVQLTSRFERELDYSCGLEQRSWGRSRRGGGLGNGPVVLGLVESGTRG